MDHNKLQNYRYRPIILGVIIFVSMLLLIPLVIPDTKHRIATLEIFGLVIIPLFIFYARSNWSQRMWGLNIPLLVLVWFSTYGMLHELSHLIGVVVVGDKILDYHLMPRFWEGDFDFTIGWFRSQGLNDWRDVIPGLSPYFRDIALLVAGFLILNSKRIRNSSFAGLIYVLFCLSSLYDIVDNYFNGYIVGHALGNDFLGTEMKIGNIWTNVIGILFASIAAFVSGWIIFIYKNVPNTVETKGR
jgi:hypothetical protein